MIVADCLAVWQIESRGFGVNFENLGALNFFSFIQFALYEKIFKDAPLRPLSRLKLFSSRIAVLSKGGRYVPSRIRRSVLRVIFLFLAMVLRDSPNANSRLISSYRSGVIIVLAT